LPLSSLTQRRKRQYNFNTPFRRLHDEANMKQMYSIYTCTTCALSLLYVCFIAKTGYNTTTWLLQPGEFWSEFCFLKQTLAACCSVMRHFDSGMPGRSDGRSCLWITFYGVGFSKIVSLYELYVIRLFLCIFNTLLWLFITSKTYTIACWEYVLQHRVCLFGISIGHFLSQWC